MLYSCKKSEGEGRGGWILLPPFPFNTQHCFPLIIQSCSNVNRGGLVDTTSLHRNYWDWRPEKKSAMVILSVFYFMRGSDDRNSVWEYSWNTSKDTEYWVIRCLDRPENREPTSVTLTPPEREADSFLILFPKDGQRDCQTKKETKSTITAAGGRAGPSQLQYERLILSFLHRKKKLEHSCSEKLLHFTFIISELCIKHIGFFYLVNHLCVSDFILDVSNRSPVLSHCVQQKKKCYKNNSQRFKIDTNETWAVTKQDLCVKNLCV